MIPADQDDKQARTDAEAIELAIHNMLSLLLTRKMNRIDAEINGFGKVTAYRIVDIIRIDVKPYA